MQQSTAAFPKGPKKELLINTRPDSGPLNWDLILYQVKNQQGETVFYFQPRHASIERGEVDPAYRLFDVPDECAEELDWNQPNPTTPATCS